MAKQVAAKKAEQTTKISAKKVGVNIISTIDGKTYSAKLSDKDKEVLKKKIEMFNKKNTDANKKAIIKLLSPVATEKEATKERLETKQKGLKKLAKKTVKEAKAKSKSKPDKEAKVLIADVEKALSANDLTVEELEALLKKAKGVEEVAPKARITTNPRKGEVYRNGRYVTVYYAEDGREVDAQGYLV